jgi:hypothetical protein
MAPKLTTGKYTIQDIGYFEDLYGCDLATTEYEVCVDFAYYWFTENQYIAWREELYGKSSHEAKEEFEWLRTEHTLFQFTEGGEQLFLIDVKNVEAFQELVNVLDAQAAAQRGC